MKGIGRGPKQEAGEACVCCVCVLKGQYRCKEYFWYIWLTDS